MEKLEIAGQLLGIMVSLLAIRGEVKKIFAGKKKWYTWIYLAEGQSTLNA